MALTMRSRNIIGTFALIGFIVVYALVIMLLGVWLLEDASQVFSVFYYLVTGCAWAFPAMIIIKWMMKPDQPAR
ncbi:MAG: DUF2842 domain-containing protein [Devosiaceae bacterium]